MRTALSVMQMRGSVFLLCFVCFFGCFCIQAVSKRHICPDNCLCCHTETEVSDRIFYLIQSQYADNRPASPDSDLATLGARQCRYLDITV